MSCWAYLKEDTPFGAIFPDGKVWVRSIVPIVPRATGCPPCYVVDASLMTSAQIARMAELLLQKWEGECQSLDVAVEYIVNTGVPLRTDWFTGVATNDLFYVAHGVAAAFSVLNYE